MTEDRDLYKIVKKTVCAISIVSVIFVTMTLRIPALNSIGDHWWQHGGILRLILSFMLGFFIYISYYKVLFKGPWGLQIEDKEE